jgi:hypothetical protein
MRPTFFVAVFISFLEFALPRLLGLPLINGLLPRDGSSPQVDPHQFAYIAV